MATLHPNHDGMMPLDELHSLKNGPSQHSDYHVLSSHAWICIWTLFHKKKCEGRFISIQIALPLRRSGHLTLSTFSPERMCQERVPPLGAFHFSFGYVFFTLRLQPQARNVVLSVSFQTATRPQSLHFMPVLIDKGRRLTAQRLSPRLVGVGQPLRRR